MRWCGNENGASVALSGEGGSSSTPGVRMVRATDISEDAVGPLRQACDLDVLLFFRRYPHALITSEKLAVYVGYDVKQVGRSLETLIGAAVLTRSPNPTHEARLYVLTADPLDGWLGSVLSAASTQEGRTALIRMLKQRELHQKAERITKRGGASGSGLIQKGQRD